MGFICSRNTWHLFFHRLRTRFCYNSTAQFQCSYRWPTVSASVHLYVCSHNCERVYLWVVHGRHPWDGRKSD